MNMKQNLVRAFVTLCIISATVTSKAYDIYVDGIYYNIISEENRTVEVTEPKSYGLYKGHIIIPPKVIYKGLTYSVTSIEDWAFYICDGLTSVEIPNSVTSIGDLAFYSCDGLTSVVIPNSVTSIGNNAFKRCGGLTSVEIPNSVTSIGGSCFSNCNNLAEIIVDSGNMYYTSEDGVLYNKDMSTIINFPGGKSGDFIIPNSVTSIGIAAFDGCTKLTSVEIPNSVTSIGNYAFQSCGGLTSVEIPNSVTSIGYGTFNLCSGLTSVEIPNSVTSIGIAAFESCYGLTSVEIPNSVTSIGNNAFYWCLGLTSVVIPNSVTSIGNNAFNSCINLDSVYCMAETPPSANATNAFDEKALKGTLFVPKGTVSAYSTTDPWRNFWNIVEIDEEDFPSGITTVADDGNFTVTINGNTINVGGTGSRRIYVYASDGQCVYSGTKTTVTNLPGGIYIVKCGNRTKKVAL